MSETQGFITRLIKRDTVVIPAELFHRNRDSDFLIVVVPDLGSRYSSRSLKTKIRGRAIINVTEKKNDMYFCPTKRFLCWPLLIPVI